MGCVFQGAAQVAYSHHTFLQWEREPVGNTWKDNDFQDLDRQMNGDFFSNADAITITLEETSHIELSDEAITEPTVSIKFGADGLAHEEELPDEPRQAGGLLEPMTLPNGMGATEAGSAFAETLARVQEMTCISLPKAIRYDSRAGGVVKVSALPSPFDYSADVQITARKCLSRE